MRQESNQGGNGFRQLVRAPGSREDGLVCQLQWARQIYSRLIVCRYMCGRRGEMYCGVYYLYYISCGDFSKKKPANLKCPIWGVGAKPKIGVKNKKLYRGQKINIF